LLCGEDCRNLLIRRAAQYLDAAVDLAVMLTFAGAGAQVDLRLPVAAIGIFDRSAGETDLRWLLRKQSAPHRRPVKTTGP